MTLSHIENGLLDPSVKRKRGKRKNVKDLKRKTMKNLKDCHFILRYLKHENIKVTHRSFMENQFPDLLRLDFQDCEYG